MTFAEAKRELEKVGCAHASGDALRAMYAMMLPHHSCLTKTTAQSFYEHFGKFKADCSIEDEAIELLRNPLRACEVGLGG